MLLGFFHLGCRLRYLLRLLRERTLARLERVAVGARGLLFEFHLGELLDVGGELRELLLDGRPGLRGMLQVLGSFRCTDERAFAG